MYMTRSTCTLSPAIYVAPPSPIDFKMEWEHTKSERHMRQRIKARRAAVAELRRSIQRARQTGANKRLAQRMFEAADSDDCVFTEWFGEPLPVHWRLILRLETDLW